MQQLDAQKMSSEKYLKNPEQIEVIKSSLECFERIKSNLLDFCDPKDEVIRLTFETLELSKTAVLNCLDTRFKLIN
jgi:hypothetical protein